MGDAACGLGGDVLVEGARRGAGGEDALDGLVVEGAEEGGVAERGVEIGGGEALAEQEDLAGLVAPDPRRPGAHEAEEARGVFAHLLEGAAELVEVHEAVAARARVEPGRVEPEPLAAGRELVACDAGEVGGVDEELALGDADRQDVGDVVIGHGVGVAFPGDEAVDGADAVDDPRGVVGVARQGHEALALTGEAIERRLAMPASLVDDGVEPVGELRPQVLEVAEGATVEKRALGLPEAPLDAGLGVGVTAHGAGAKLVVGGEGEEAWIVDGLLPLPAQDDIFLAVVGAHLGAPPEAREGLSVPIHERMEVRVPVEVVVLAPGVDEHIRECLDLLLVAVCEEDVIRRPVVFGHLPRSVIGRRQAGGRARRGALEAHVFLDGGVAALEALLAQGLEDPLGGDVTIQPEQLGDARGVRVDLGRAWRAGRSRGDRRLPDLARGGVGREHDLDRVAADAERAGEGPT